MNRTYTLIIKRMTLFGVILFFANSADVLAFPSLANSLGNKKFQVPLATAKKNKQIPNDSLSKLRDSLRTRLKNSIDVTLPDSDVPVLFGTQKNVKKIQSSATISGEELKSFPTPQVGLMLYGKLPGLYVVQNNFQLGSDEPILSLRGRSPLVVIDGVPRSYLSIDPEQIESISVIKDALGTGLYGMKAADGVLLITTKRGANMPKQITFTSQYGIQQQIDRPKFLDAFNYATLFNEALANDGRQAIYTASDLDKYKNGTSPFTHPNVNWTDEILKATAPVSRQNLNLRGGTKKVRYFVDLDYLSQSGFLATDPSINTYETNNSFKRFSFRSNIDVDLTNSTTLSVSLFGRIRNSNQPGATVASIYSALLTTPNNAYPKFNENGSLGGNTEFQNNLYGMAIKSGYRPSVNRNLGADISLMQKLDTFLPGLYASGAISFNSYYNENINRSKSFAVYSPVVNPVTNQTTYKAIGGDGTQSNSSSPTDLNQQIFSRFDLGYDKIIDKNTFKGQLLFIRDSYVLGGNLSQVNQSVGGRFNYDYDNKYLLEIATSYMGYDRYKKGDQWGLFPSVGLGWNMANENFFANLKNTINTLKLRASYGLTATNAAAGYFQYLQNFDNGDTFYSRNPLTSSNTKDEGTLANPNITWEKAKKLNVGIDVSLLKDKVWFTADYYKNNYYDLLQIRRTNASAVIGAVLPQENIGKNQYSGVELGVGYQDQINSFKYFISANGSWNASKVIFNDEPFRKNAYEYRTGQPVGQTFGYIADGFYNNTSEINNGPKVDGYLPVPGDLKYKDLNNDGIINTYDMTAIGSTKPVFYYGVTGGFNFKGFDFSFTLNGTANRNVYYNFANFASTGAGAGYGQALESSLQRWTPATALQAQYPRLSVGINPNNNQISSFWVKNGNYLRLRNVEVGYSLPGSLIKVIGLTNVRLFANGLNLLTSTNLDGVDPEVLIGNVPNQRIFNFGVNIQF
ncbi:SusC/RagA family TonB-linked outer membrane protein [Pedobacter sp. KBW01]|uniref:SusC/RagA family TonB-linked outer membrane protein n=1 Tax=Pedobacter sp. KBW01 TaxID=2153364 RepID=UPI000F5B304A|nr:SusC/RagA family TonB-linked outer membrane protein [Pedobacter sp. KBW01]RQO76534.1 SusC/RagA family TonB-linked outer membrane protein [Pedobacter sp. KBW01]